MAHYLSPQRFARQLYFIREPPDSFALDTPPLEQFTDDFASIGPRWTINNAGSGSTITATGSQLVISAPTTANSYPNLAGADRWSLIDSFCSVEVVGLVAGTTSYFKLQHTADANYAYQFELTPGGTLQAYEVLNNVFTSMGSATYNATAHRYLRFREVGSVVYAEASPDGGAWTVIGSRASIGDVYLTSVTPLLMVQGTTSNTGSSVFDHLNIVTPTLSKSGGASASASAGEPLFLNSADPLAVTHGATPTTANTAAPDAWSAVSALASTWSFDATVALKGSLAYKNIGTAAANSTYLERVFPSSYSELYARTYFRLDAAPATTQRLMRFLSGSTVLCSLAVSTSRFQQIFAGSGGNTQIQGGSVAIPLNQWVRLEFHVVFSGTVAVLEGRLFLNADSVTPDETITISGQNTNGLGTADRFRIGHPGGGPAIGSSYWLDDIAVNTGGWLGPSLPTVRPLGSFVEDFSGTLAKFTTVGTASIVSGRLALSGTSSTATTEPNFTLKDSEAAAYIDLTGLTGTIGVALRAYVGPSDYFQVLLNGTTYFVSERPGGLVLGTEDSAAIPRLAGWWRIRHQTGTGVLFQHSADGITWTTVKTIAAPTIDVSLPSASLSLRTSSAHTATGNATFDNVNLLPVAVGTLSDTFSGAWFTNPPWAQVTDTTLVAGRARINSTSAYPGLRTPSSYIFRGSQVWVEVPTIAGLGGNGSHETQLMVNTLDVAQFGITADLTNISFRWVPIGGPADNVTITYDSTAHRWWRVRELSGTVYWDTSADGVTWTNRRTMATPAVNIDTSVQAQLTTGWWNSESITTYAEFDNFNVVGTPAGTTVSKSGGASSAATAGATRTTGVAKAGGALSAPTNLLLNGSAEIDLSNNSLNGAATGLTRVAGGYEGSWAMQVTTNAAPSGSGDGIRIDGVAGTVAPGDAVTLTIAAKTAGSGTAYVGASERDSAGALLRDTFGAAVSLTATYTVLRFRMIAGASVDRVHLKIASATPSFTFVADNAVVRVGTRSGATKTVVQAVAKTGGAAATASAGATRATAVTKAGGAASTAAAGAPRTGSVAKAGGAASTSTAGATKAIAVAKAGGAASVGASGATRTATVVKAGGAASTAAAGATRALAPFAKAGGAAATSAAGGTKALAQIITKVGGAAAIAAAGGTRLVTRARSGGAALTAATGATRAATVAKAGGGASTAAAGGTRTVLRARSGGAASIAAAGGSRATVRAKTGGASSAATAGAPKTVLIVKTAGASSAGASGATKAALVTKAGGASSARSAGGTRTLVIVKAGGASSVRYSGATRTTTIAKAGGGSSALAAGAPRAVTRLASGGASATARAGAGTAGPSYASEVLADLPAAYWGMGAGAGTETDLSGGGHTLTVAKPGGTPVASGLVAGADAGATYFQGTSDAAYAVVNIAGTPGVTFEAWLVVWAYDSASDDLLLEYGAPPWYLNNGTAIVDLNNSTSGESGTISIGVADSTGQQARVTIPQSALPTGEAHHLAITYDASGANSVDPLRVYVDGVRVTATSRGVATPAGSFSPGTAISAAGANLSVAARNASGSGSLFANVTLDELAVYDHVVSPARLAAHVAAASGGGAGGVGVLVAKTGGATSTAATGATKATTAARTGGAAATASAGATKAIAVVKAGGAASAGRAGGTSTKSLVIAKAGGARLGYLTTLTGPLATETNAVFGGTDAGGTRVTVYGRAGGASTIARAGGARASSVARLGGASAALAAGGVRGTVFVKAGGASSALAAGGASARSFAKSGGASSAASAGAPRTLTLGRAGGAAIVGRSGATKAITVAKAGGARAVAASGATRTVLRTRAGGAAATAASGGTRTTLRTIAKAGGASAVTAAGGGRIFLRGTTGGARSTTSAGAVRLTQRATAGGASAQASTGGTPLRRVSRAGGAIAETSTGALRIVGLTVDGGASANATGGGVLNVRLPATVPGEWIVVFDPVAATVVFETGEDVTVVLDDDRGTVTFDDDRATVRFD